MKIYHILNQRFRFTGLLLILVLFSGTLIAQDDNAVKKIKLVDVSIKVVDESGNPLPGIQVIVGEGVIHALTDENGAFSFKASPEEFVTFSDPVYDKSVFLVDELYTDNLVKLKKSKLFMTSEDDIYLPFATLKKRHVTGSYTTVASEKLEKYPSSDIRNALTGLVPGLTVTERNGMPGQNTQEERSLYRLTEKVRVASRGRNMTYIIDNVPMNINEMPLDPGEIESVTVVKDIVGKAMFGPAAADGIIYIKTKRGNQNERVLNVNVEAGVSEVDRFPEWTNGVDYANLNNTARKNSGLAPVYTDKAIGEYSKNDPYNWYYPNTDYREMMLKDTRPYTRANVSSSGGNNVVQYAAYLGYTGEGDIYKIGSTSKYDRINTRGNLDIKVNEYFKVQFDLFAGISLRQSPNYGYNSNYTSEDGNTNTALDLVEFSSAIADITNTPPVAFPVYANFDPTSKVPWYGLSANYTTNPIGNLMDNGYYDETGRTGAANVALNWDMSTILKGLTSKTFLGFNVFNLTRIGKAEDYIAYQVTPGFTASGADTAVFTKKRNGFDMADQAKLYDYYFQRFVIYENLNYTQSFGDHDLQASFTYYLSKATKNGIEEPERQQNAVLSANYSYNDKYIIHGVANYAGTYSFDEGNRYELFPSIGVGWVMTEESFMSGIKFLNYLKLRAEAGILGYESFLAPFYYRDRWNVNQSGSAFGPFSTGQWFGSATDAKAYRTSASRIGNPDLTWEKRKEFSIGLDATMLNNKLSFELNYYNNLRDGMISQLSNTMPYVAGNASARPWFNYNQIRYTGYELGLQYSDKSGKFRYSFGGNATFSESEIIKYDEPNFRFDYQSRIGTPTDGIWGQTYLGKFQSDEEANQIPQLFDAMLHTGDLKYKDMNEDGFVDENDQSLIGNSAPKLVYALNVSLSYKNFELFVMGSGVSMVDLQMTNKYFWNGWGDNNYSKFVKDNVGGAYPSLTYNKVNNNYVGSDFWLTNGAYFKIQNIELAYTLPGSVSHVIGSRGIRFFVRGANLLTISDVKEIDPESPDSGVTTYPLYSTFTGGVKLTF